MSQKQSKAMQDYKEMVSRLAPKSALGQGLLRAFWVGGLICVLGQGIKDLAIPLLGVDKETAGTVASITLVFLTALFTGVGLFDQLGKYAGGGTIVPITGFANSIVACAMEFKREGFITGIGAKMFTIAGPVLVYGISTSVIAGIIYFFVK